MRVITNMIVDLWKTGRIITIDTGHFILTTLCGHHCLSIYWAPWTSVVKDVSLAMWHIETYQSSALVAV